MTLRVDNLKEEHIYSHVSLNGLRMSEPSLFPADNRTMSENSKLSSLGQAHQISQLMGGVSNASHSVQPQPAPTRRMNRMPDTTEAWFRYEIDFKAKPLLLGRNQT